MTSVVIVSSDCAQVRNVCFSAQVAPLVPAEHAQAIHFIRLAQQFVVIGVWTVPSQFKVFQCTLPSRQREQFGFLCECQLILERVHFAHPEHFPVEQPMSS